ncbi:hypothetical protein BN132_1641 [Cronobacter turicensis 564]|nr:hypothetical protein BN132_1641 [Cronobacter turicensis 564]
MAFRFYETAFYFLGNIILVIRIVIPCFKNNENKARDLAQ